TIINNATASNNSKAEGSGECVLIDLGSILSEHEVEFQFGTSPISYRRRYLRVYAHRKGNVIS
ncbi:MAG: hypothetical protein ACPLYF_05085, partial [Fervidobacterium sp.]